jgi:hypothetical protein
MWWEVLNRALLQPHFYNRFAHLDSSRVHRACIHECNKLKIMAFSGITFMPIFVDLGLMFQNLCLWDP